MVSADRKRPAVRPNDRSHRAIRGRCRCGAPPSLRIAFSSSSPSPGAARLPTRRPPAAATPTRSSPSTPPAGPGRATSSPSPAMAGSCSPSGTGRMQSAPGTGPAAGSPPGAPLRWPVGRDRRGAIYALALSPDPGQRYAAVAGFGLADGAVAVLDRTTGRVVHGTTGKGNGQDRIETVYGAGVLPRTAPVAVGQILGILGVATGGRAGGPDPARATRREGPGRPRVLQRRRLARHPGPDRAGPLVARGPAGQARPVHPRTPRPGRGQPGRAVGRRPRPEHRPEPRGRPAGRRAAAHTAAAGRGVRRRRRPVRLS